MNRVLFSLVAVLGGLLPLIFDSALKGAVLLVLASLVALALWRASAAARHLVWLVAIVTLLVVPVLSLALPQWRVLPGWAVVERGAKGTERTEGTKVTAPLPPLAKWEPVAEDESFSDSPLPTSPLAPAPLAAESTAAPLITDNSSLITPAPTWRDWLPLAWCVGFALLAVRLLAAHLLLRRASRHCPALTAPPDEKIAAAFADACKRLGITQRVTLLLDKKRTIPVVWGVFRPRLMLPLEAREWSDEQLCSVLLHELGHIKRRDTLVQWLTQIACALHWWNPLVWLAAWRLHAERERACDDLVLASGVRPSAYAEHLLDVATRLSPARWTSACGLAMARKSSLEGRLMAVLSEKLNRNGVTRALAIAALVLGAAIALPVAMLRAADEKWNPPHAAHVGSNDLGVYCVHDGTNAAFVLVYRGSTGSASTHDSNPKTRTWSDSGTLTAKKSGISLGFHRTHDAPSRLKLTTGLAENRDRTKPAPPQSNFGQKEYDLGKGRVFLLADDGAVRQLDIPTPLITKQEHLEILSKQILAFPPETEKASEGSVVMDPKTGEVIAVASTPKIAKGRGRILDRNSVVLAESTGDGSRNYPYKALAAHAIGFLAPNDAGSAQGRTGSEKMFNDTLAKGEDVSLSIDARIQSIVDHTLIDSGIGRGAAVVIDLDDGGVVATASMPNYDPARFVTGDFLDAAKLYGENEADPLVDRATTAYAPGSSVTPVTTLAGLVNSVSPSKTWNCAGGVSYGGRVFKCTGSHGPLDAVGAIKKSCNCYSYQAAIQVGLEPFAKTAHALGLGSPLSSYVFNESGVFPNTAWFDANFPGKNLASSSGELANMSVGQGHVTATPLQMAWVAAQIAKSGKLPRAHIQKGMGEPVDLSLNGIPAEAFQAVRSGMWKVVNETGGTASRAKSKQFEIAGKTGTAQFFRTTKKVGSLAEKSPDNVVWFIGYAPAVNPKYAIAVMAETGGGQGTGGRVAAPIGRKIVEETMSPLPQPAVIPESKGHLDGVEKVEFPSLTQITPTPEQYVKSGIPLAELKEDVVWNGTENGLSLGYRIIGDEWRILDMQVNGKQVKVELWLRNIGTEGVKFQSTMRPDIGLRMKLKNERGEETKAHIVPNDRPPFGEQRLLPPGHALKVKDFPISLFRPVNDVSSVRDHYFPIEPGAYEFHCELELPGFSATGEGGKQLTPAAGEWTGKLTTPSVNVQVVDLHAPKSVLPKNQYARAHFEQWRKYARPNGDIPGGLVALLDDSLARKDDPKLKELRKRLDGTRDWPAQEAADLLDALAATGNWLDDDGWLRLLEHGDIEQGGKPLPPELASLPWGKADDSTVPVSKVPTGLRAAFTLDPAAASYAQGTQLSVTSHYHNSGTAPVVFPIGFRSMDMVEARDSQGRKVFSSWAFPDADTGKLKDGPWKAKRSVRLEPGQWISVTGAELTLANGSFPFTKDVDGNVLMAQADSTVMLKWLPMTSTWRESQGGEMDWKQRVEMAVARFSPMPKSHAERESIIRRVTFALFGEDPTAADIAAFAEDDSVNALAKLTARLQALPRPLRFGGWLRTGEQTLKITPAAADYRGTVMSANGSGVYELTESVVLQHYGSHANFEFMSQEPAPHPRTIDLKGNDHRMVPHGIVWRHGSGVVFVAEKERVRKYDFSVPGKLTKTDLPAGIASIPEDLRAELLKAFPAAAAAAIPKIPAVQSLEDGSLGLLAVEKLADGISIKVRASKYQPLRFSIGESDPKFECVFPPDGKQHTVRVSLSSGEDVWWKRLRFQTDDLVAETLPEIPSDWLPEGQWNWATAPVIAQRKAVIAELADKDGKRSEISVSLAPRNPQISLPVAGNGMQVETYFRIYELGEGAPPQPTRLSADEAARILAPAGAGVARARATTGGGLQAIIETIREFRHEAKPGEWVVDNMGVTCDITPMVRTTGFRVETSVSLGLYDGKYQTLADAIEAANGMRGDNPAGNTNPAPPPNAKPRHIRAAYSGDVLEGEVLLLPIKSEGLFPGHAVAAITFKRVEPTTERTWRRPLSKGVKRSVILSSWLLAIPPEEVQSFTKQLPMLSVITDAQRRPSAAPEQFVSTLSAHNISELSKSPLAKMEALPEQTGTNFQITSESLPEGMKLQIDAEAEGEQIDFNMALIASNLRKITTNVSVMNGAATVYYLPYEKGKAVRAMIVQGTIQRDPSPAAEQPLIQQRRNLDWSKFPYYEAPEIPFANPFIPADALRLAAVPNKSKEDVKRLVDMIHQATAEKAVELRPLLADKKLNASDDKDGRIGFALAAYDYSVNGNKAGLQLLLDAMALDDKRKAEAAAWSLVYVDEWELTQKAFDEHFGRFANAEEHDLFWKIRKFLYPEKHAQFKAKQSETAVLPKAPEGAALRFRELLHAVFYLPKAKTWEMKVGERVGVKVDGVGDFMGEVFSISEKPEPRSGLVNVKVALPENNPRIRAGLIARFGEWSGLIFAKHPFSEPSELLGTWRGKLNEKNIMLSFHRPPAETVVHLDIYEGEATIGMIARFNIAEDGKSAVVVLDHADSATYGTLRPGENGTLRLTLTRDEERVPDASIVLTRDAEAVESKETMQAIPKRAHQWNDQFAAIAYQTEKETSFVLIHEGSISAGLSETALDNGKWRIEGSIQLVDAAKTKAAGKNVDKRVIPLKHSSDAPGTLSLDGKEFDLKGGRVFILRDEGAPEQLDKTMPLRNKADLEKLGGLIKNTVPARGVENFVVYLNGEFQNPRTFVVPENVPKTALAIIDAAGGVSEKGDLSLVRITNWREVTMSAIPESPEIRTGNAVISSTTLRRRAKLDSLIDTTLDLTEIRAGKRPDIAVPQRGVITIPSIEDTRKLKPGESFTLVVPPLLNYTDVAAPAPALPNEGMKLTVNADGKLIDAAYGTVDTAGRMIKEVRKELLDRIEMRRKIGVGMSDATFNALWDDFKKEKPQETEKPKSALMPPASGAASGLFPLDLPRTLFEPRTTSPVGFFTFSKSGELDPGLVAGLEERPANSLRAGNRARTLLAGQRLYELREQYEITKRLFEAGSIPSHVFYLARDAYFAAQGE